MPDRHTPVHVSLVATPDAQATPLCGIFETLNGFDLLSNFETGLPARPFEVEIVAPDDAPVTGASGLPLGAHRPCAEIERTDIVIVPLMMVDGADWKTGRYCEVVNWLRRMNVQGAVLCSACTGVLLLAETGLLDGHEATIHWAFAPTFRRNFPEVRLRTEEGLITAGEQEQFIMTGGVTSWHDLVLYLIARNVGSSAAHGMARLMMLEWHGEWQAPYVTFSPRTNHDDALIAKLQRWLETHYMVANPVKELQRVADLPRRSLERRFASATGHSPITYVQAVRIEEAKRRLERSDTPVDDVSVAVGYENKAFFRRLFKRTTRLTPGAFRRKFRMPGFG